MSSLYIDRSRLITPSAFAKKHGISPAAVSKKMDTGNVDVVKITGGRLILEP